MKKLIVIILSLSLFAFNGCSVKLVGKVTMVSDRNMESKTEYVLMKCYMGASKKELRRSRAVSVEDAIDQTVKNTAGGEFLKNVKIYLVNGSYFAVEGDVWGIATNQNIRGWKVGDRVQWKGPVKKINTGVITDLKNASVVNVKDDTDGKIKEVTYDKLIKSE